MKLSFDNTQVAFSGKDDKELRRAYRLFRMMNNRLMVRLGSAIALIFLKFRLPIGTFIRRSFYDHFCAGESLPDCTRTIVALDGSNTFTILDYGVEAKSSEADFERTKKEMLALLEFAGGNDRLPVISCKLTGLGKSSVLRKVSAGSQLSEADLVDWAALRQRFEAICRAAYESATSLFVDAEESWLQKAIDDLTEEMMQRWNKDKPLIYNTIQLYRHDRLDFLKSSLDRSVQGGYLLAVKLVRGAYMEKERLYAGKNGKPSPIHASKPAVDHDYNAALEFCVNHIDKISLCAATHNEESCLLLARLVEEKELDHKHPHVWFCQLYGMSDHITYNLASEGYNASKFVPYGPVREVVPYLIRRAEENTSVAGQMSRELHLIHQEINRRTHQK